MCISSVLQSNRNSIEFSLSTWTRRRSKAPQSKFLHPPVNTTSGKPISGSNVLQCVQLSWRQQMMVVFMVQTAI